MYVIKITHVEKCLLKTNSGPRRDFWTSICRTHRDINVTSYNLVFKNKIYNFFSRIIYDVVDVVWSFLCVIF